MNSRDTEIAHCASGNVTYETPRADIVPQEMLLTRHRGRTLCLWECFETAPSDRHSC